MSVLTGATILAWTGLALILFLITMLPYPASLTLTTVPLQKRQVRVKNMKCESILIVITTALVTAAKECLLLGLLHY